GSPGTGMGWPQENPPTLKSVHRPRVRRGINEKKGSLVTKERTWGEGPRSPVEELTDKGGCEGLANKGTGARRMSPGEPEEEGLWSWRSRWCDRAEVGGGCRHAILTVH